MGKLNDSLLAGTTGRTGRIVVTNVYGNEYTRIRPKKRKSAPTPKQALVQKRMKDGITFMQSYRGYACKHFGTRSGTKSPYILALKNVLESFLINYDTAEITVSYQDILFSKGALMGPIPINLTLTTPSSLEISWQDNAGGDPNRENDWLQILVAAEQDTTTLFMENTASRNAEIYTLNIPRSMQDKTLHIYLAFKSTDATKVSNSVYAGSVG